MRLGFVRRAHGIQGEVEIETFDPQSRALKKGVRLRFEGEDVTQARHILAVRTIGGSAPDSPRRSRGGAGLLVRLEGCESRTDAEALKGKQFDVEREALPKTKKDEFYVVDLVGFRVETVAGAVVGELAGFDPGGGSGLLVVVAGDGRRHLIPAVPEFVVRVERERKTIVIDPPEGLLEL